MNLLNFGKEKLLNIVKDPFSKKQITGIRVDFSKSLFSDKWSATAYVDFKNENTTGKQKFEANTFDEVVLQMKSFIQTL